MIQTNLLAHGHSDLVTHIVYDYYGERLATCSADQKIKLFRRLNDGSWELETEWKAHDAPILRLSFAHPLHGSLLASCSHDRSVRVWEEPSSSSAAASASVAAVNKDGRWLEKGTLTGMKGSVRDVEFGPADPGLGLRIASISTDSRLRIHLSLDPSLNDWSMAHNIHVPSLNSGPGEEGHDDGSAAAASTAELATGAWGLSWCKEKWWGSVLACFAGTSPGVKIISLDPKPTVLLHLLPPTSSASPAPLTALSWAPSCGRSYHHLATGARDGTVRIWKVVPPNPDDEGGSRTWKGEVVAEFARGARVGMVDWNATGTVLTTSDDDGMIRIYKQTYAKEWKLMGKMTAEEPHDEASGH